MGVTAHCVISDRGWILEKFAREIADRLPWVSLGSEIRPGADIQYYITYGCRRDRVSPAEAALFTHLEAEPTAAAKFIAVAREVEAAVAMSNATAAVLAREDIAHCVIMPGVDLERFTPTLRIGVVGRTYHTGRKGEALVAAAMDIPGIEWRFTGDGWPGPALRPSDEDLPEFYRSLDYVLVPSLVEGGPMCVLEALACGVPVIAGDVGWAPEFPRIPFETGDAASLRRVLTELLDRKFALRKAVEARSWDTWAEAHEKLFRQLARDSGGSSPPVHVAAPPLRARSVSLVTHGDEGLSVGGPSVRVPRLASELAARGVAARTGEPSRPDAGNAALIHAFNVWPPQAALAAARLAEAGTQRLVFSPILLDLSESSLWGFELSLLFDRCRDPAEAAARWEVARAAARARGLAPMRRAEPEPGYLAAIQGILRRADGLVLLSEHERRLLDILVPGPKPPSAVIRNPVDAAASAAADPEAFKSALGVSDYVLCVGRIEYRKNQLLLALALRELDLPLVLVGHAGDAKYLELLKRVAGPNLRLAGRLEPGSAALRSAMAGARVFVLPSWAEGAPLAALEAGAAGAALALSDRSSEREYFGDLARYCDPSDTDSIRQTVVAAWDAPRSASDREELRTHVAEAFSWARHVDRTLDFYDAILARPRAPRPAPPAAPIPEPTPTGSRVVILDVTTSLAHGRLRSGIMRVERALASALQQDGRARLRFVAWRSQAEGFVEIPPWAAEVGDGAARDRHARTGAFDVADLPAGAPLLVLGSGWMQNPAYAAAMRDLAREAKLELTVLMHDLTPVIGPHWFADGYTPRFRANMEAMLGASDRLLAYSENTRRDVIRHAAATRLAIPRIDLFRLADAIATPSGPPPAGLDAGPGALSPQLSGRPFALAVGAAHPRKNYALLYDVWRILGRRPGGARPDLVIVGGFAWGADDLARALRNDPDIRDRVHIVEDVDDASLDWLYRNCLFTLYPSLYEGWGLPVGESLAYGKICLASNASSIPEIAPTLTDLLDPLDPAAWATRIAFYAGSAAARSAREARIRAEFVPTTWRDTARGLVDALERPVERPDRDIYCAGSVLRPVLGATGHLQGGWSARESWGVWAMRRDAELRLVFEGPHHEPLHLTAICRYFGPADAPERCRIFAGGRHVADWLFLACGPDAGPSDFALRRAVIPPSAIGDDGVLLLRFCSDRRHRPREIDPEATDDRLLGFGLAALWIAPASTDAVADWRIDGLPALAAAPPLAGRQAAPEALLRSSRRGPALPVDRWWPPGASLSQLAAGALVGSVVASRGREGVAIIGALNDICLARPLLIEAVVCSEAGGRIELLVNDQPLAALDVAPNVPALVAAEAPSEIVARRDPAEIRILPAHGAAAFATSAPGVALLQMRLSQTPVGQPHSLAPDAPLDLTTVRDKSVLRGAWTEPDGWSVGDLGWIEANVAPGNLSTGIPALALEVSLVGRGPHSDPVALVLNDDVSWDRVDLGGGSAEIVERGFAVVAPSGPVTLRTSRLLGWPTPAELGLAADGRCIGIRPKRLSLVTLEHTPPGLWIEAAADNRRILWSGWHDPDGVGRWSARSTADLWLAPQGKGPRLIEIDVAGFGGADGAPQTLRLAIQDSAVELAFHEAATAVRSVLLKAAEDGPLVHLSVCAAQIRSPDDAGLAPDQRPCGALLLRLRWTPCKP